MDAKTQWWTPEQDRILLDHFNRSHAWLAEKVSAIGPARSSLAVKERRQRLAMSKPNDSWGSPELIARMAKLYGQGESAAQIAKALNREFGTSLSRCAVIGKTRRLGLTKPERFTTNRKLAQAPARIAKRRASPPPPAKAARQFRHGAGCDTGSGSKPPRDVWTTGPTPQSLNVRMWDERFTGHCCRWATKEDATGHFFCAAPALPDMPYCSAHDAVAYKPTPRLPPSAVKDSAPCAAKTDDGEPRPLDFEKAA